MQRHTIKPGDEGFDVVTGNPRAQVARMELGPNDSVGGPDNRHAHSDQWLYVVDGAGHAVVKGRTVALKAGALLLIEAGEPHEIVNDSDGPLQTLNFYVPPAY